MAPLKNGVGFIALELLKRAHDAGNDDFTVTVSCSRLCTVAIYHIHVN
jgi:hypothetical protein